MARRNIGGGEDEDYAAFLASRQQPQTDPRMTMAMQIMNLMDKSQSEQQRQALDERQQAALEKYQAGQLGIEEAKRKTAETEAGSLASAREAEKTYRIQQGMDTAGKEATRQKEAADTLAMQTEAKNQALAQKTLDTLIDKGLVAKGDPEYNRLMEKVTPGYGEEVKKSEAEIRGRKIAEGVARYQKATPKEREAYAKTPGALATPDVYDEILKQAGVNVAQPGAPATASGGLSGGIQDVLWNLPGGVENIFRGVSNLGSKAWYGGNAPQYSYVPWTKASEEIPKYLGEGPPVAPPPAGPMPRPQYGNYGVQAEPAGAPPEWQYGVGQQRPPAPSLNDLLAKALENQ